MRTIHNIMLFEEADNEDDITLDLDESNEMLFKIDVDGAPHDAVVTVRLACEGKDMTYVFVGMPTDERDVIRFEIPKMMGRLDEGTYKNRVEVVVDNRYFVPAEFDVTYIKNTRVTVEALSVTKVIRPQTKVKKTLSVSASRPSLVEKHEKPSATTKPIIVSKLPNQTSKPSTLQKFDELDRQLDDLFKK